MPKYSVDIKAFVSIEVEAPNESRARVLAEEFLDSLAPHDQYIVGYNQTLAAERPGRRIIEAGGFDIDGDSVVDELEDDDRQVCSTCWDLRCDGCTPPDTPSLDTSFHDHEMGN